MDGASFSYLLKQHRIAAGLSQEALAERSGVSIDAISALERGLRQAPYKTTLDSLIAALSLDDDARDELEEAAALGRTRRPHTARRDVLGNLPPQLTSFVNRETVVAEIKELLQSHRLLTLVGTGGAGKTRCAIKVAAEILDIFRDGVWLAELAPIADPSLVASVTAQALRLQETPNRPIFETLVAYLGRKHLLLVLDNCEHVIEEARHVAAAILHACPDVRILATSRERFSIAGEQVYRMPSLPVPSTAALPAEAMSQYGAVQLFRDRAASADNRFTLTVESAPHVVDICRRLDGIPLAIELAAAQIRVLSPSELAQRLDDRFRLLTGGDRSALPRHRTMRALIDWSFDLLSEDEQHLFCSLSIFAGSFSLAVATAVCNRDDELDTLDMLSSLVDKSLVQAEATESVMRYRLLESTRQYAREKLIESGEYDVVAREHARAFLSVALQLSNDWETTPDRAWLAQAQPELENLRAALGWALSERGEVLLGQRLAAELTSVWRFLFPMEGRRWVHVAQGLVNAETPAETIAALDLADSVLDMFLMQYQASLAAAQRAVAKYAAIDDRSGYFRAKRVVGDSLIRCGRIDEGEALLYESLTEARELGARKSESSILMTLGLIRGMADDAVAARQLFSEALSVARAAGAERSQAFIVLNLAEVEFMTGDAGAAQRLVGESMSIFRVFHDVRTLANALRNESAYLVSLGRYDEARTSAREAVAAAVDRQYAVDIAFGLQHLAAVGALRSQRQTQDPKELRRAARVLGYADARTTALEAQREFTEQQEYDVVVSRLGGVLGEDALATLMREGSSWSEDQAVAEAMLI